MPPRYRMYGIASRRPHFPDMSEIRVDVDDDHIYRVLVGFGPDDRPALLLAGNKARVGSAWHETNVPIADGRFDTYLSALRQSKETRR